MEKLGTIYQITNKITGKKYVGQTARDIWTRFEEHCRARDNTALHSAIQEFGYLNFELVELEKVPLSELDQREKYWIRKLNTFETGYNSTIGGRGMIQRYNCVHILENDLVVESAAELARIISECSDWSQDFLANQIQKAVKTKQEFLGYHFENIDNVECSSYDSIQNWAKTLLIRYQGKHIYCNELDLHFDTIADCARFLIDNNFYQGNSKTPMQSLVTSIGRQLHKKVDYIQSTKGNLTFNFMPGTAKGQGSKNFEGTKIYCPQIDKEFETQAQAAQYFLSEKLWTGIKLKTAKLRISDIVNGNFPDYKGYTFQKIK